MKTNQIKRVEVRTTDYMTLKRYLDAGWLISGVGMNTYILVSGF